MSSTTIEPAPPAGAVPQTPANANAGRFLPEIQGLRAIAVGLVLLYHVSTSKLPRAGFVGVDVFFVISGFLITDHLVREVNRTGRIGLPRFYERRARRLLPAALTVLLFTTVVTYVWVPQTLWMEFGGQIIASALYVENWALAINATDYAAAASDTSAVQHFWSLGVEEQFYVFWPLLILLGAKLGRGSRTVRRRDDVGLLALVVVVSFALSLWVTGRNSGLAYFVTYTRVWELGAGGLLCFVVARTWGMSTRVRGAAAWIGVLLIAAAAFGIKDTTSFPGWQAAVPVLGAVLLIAAGANAGTFSPSPLLRLRPVQWIGDISYSLYLWHWPLLLLAPFVLGHALSGPQKLAVIPASILAAAASKYLIEDRFRANKPRPESHTRRFSGQLALVQILVLSVVICVAAGLLDHHARGHERDARAELAAVLKNPPSCFGAGALDAGASTCPDRHSGKVYPDPIIAGTELNGANKGCLVAGGVTDAHACVHGRRTGFTKDIALVGDSHAQQWLVPLLQVAAKHGWRVTTYLHSGCPLTTVAPSSTKTFGNACPTWNRNVSAVLAKRKFDAVVVSGFSGLPYSGGVDAAGRGMAEAWSPLVKAGVPVISLRDNPLPSAGGIDDTPSCVENHAADYGPCGTSEKRSLKKDPQTLAASTVSGAKQIDLTRYFCPKNSFCPAVIGGVIVYEQAGHITATYARTLTPALDDRLTPLVG